MLKPENCKLGQEQYEEFEPNVHRAGLYKNKSYVQYDYRDLDGELFSCVAPTLAQCRKKRDQWYLQKQLDQDNPFEQ
jgi:hypothetical protein